MSYPNGVQLIREAQYTMIRDYADTRLSCFSYDLPMAPDDGIHPSDESNAIIGTRIQRAIAAQEGITVDGQWKHPEVLTCSLSGNVITATFDLHEATDMTPSSGVVGGAFFDDGVEIAISSSSKTAANTYTFTLASTPSGAEQEFIMPYSNMKDVDGANLDNLIKDNSPYQMPIVPFKAVFNGDGAGSIPFGQGLYEV